MFLYNKAELTPPSVLSPNPDSKIVQLSDKYLADLQKDLLKLVDSSRRSEIASSLVNMKRSLTSLHSVAALLAFEVVANKPMQKQSVTYIETSETTKATSLFLISILLFLVYIVL
jgi:DNA uptake protein ComE-like DNA-binding protein